MWTVLPVPHSTRNKRNQNKYWKTTTINEPYGNEKAHFKRIDPKIVLEIFLLCCKFRTHASKLFLIDETGPRPPVGTRGLSRECVLRIPSVS